MHKDSIPLHALHSLLINEWKGDHVLWFGDECPVPEQSSNGVIKTLYEQSAEFGYPGDAFDMICDFSDPLPFLMGYGRVTEPGEWLGDIIGVSDQRPEGYSLIKEIYVDW